MRLLATNKTCISHKEVNLLWCVPMWNSNLWNMAMIVNKKLFDKAGIAYQSHGNELEKRIHLQVSEREWGCFQRMKGFEMIEIQTALNL